MTTFSNHFFKHDEKYRYQTTSRKKIRFSRKKKVFSEKNNKFDFGLFLGKKSKKNSIVIFSTIFRGFHGPYSNVIKIIYLYLILLGIVICINPLFQKSEKMKKNIWSPIYDFSIFVQNENTPFLIFSRKNISIFERLVNSC